MDAVLLNWKAWSSGSMIGFFDLSVCGIVITGCKAFKKPGESERLWFAWPSEKVPGKDGEDPKWRDVVTAAEPVMRHLMGLVVPQLRACLSGTAAKPKPKGNGSYVGGDREDLSMYRSKPGDGIGF